MAMTEDCGALTYNKNSAEKQQNAGRATEKKKKRNCGITFNSRLNCIVTIVVVIYSDVREYVKDFTAIVRATTSISNEK